MATRFSRARRDVGIRLSLLGLVSVFQPSPAHATQYDFVNLDPNGGAAYGIYNGTAVGGDSRADRATRWSSIPRSTTLLPSPAGFRGTVAYGIFGNQTVGVGTDGGGNAHALLWNGTSPPIDLGGPGSAALAAYNGVQVGDSGTGAYLWHGAPGGTSINPPGFGGSVASSIWGTEIAGTGGFGSGLVLDRPLVWTSLSADSAVDLTPRNSGGMAKGISRGQVVGFVGIGQTNVAALWTGPSAATFQNLAPAGTTASELFATNGTQQVGDISFSQGVDGGLPEDHNAAVWRGSSSSYQLLPNGQYATGIDDQGDIVGFSGNVNRIPILWVPHRLPGDVDFDGLVGFSDLLVLSQHYGQTGGWVDGDLNLDGTVGFDDLLILAQNYGRAQPGAVTYDVVQTPEPSLVGVIPLAAALLARERRA